jgi:SAM-dependent methyltransferase
MQTYGEKYLVNELAKFTNGNAGKSEPIRILNVGAGRNVSIENQLMSAGCKYICDRLDPDNCTVSHPFVGKCWICPVENMPMIRDNEYSAVFANYVIEHIADLKKAATQIFRILKPSGIFVATLPNISAPEFKLSKVTPLWFHKFIRGRESWETTYLYGSIYELISIFESAGLKTLNIKYFPCVETYLDRFPILGKFGRFYDKLILAAGIKKAMGDVCIVFSKAAVNTFTPVSFETSAYA